MSRPPAPTHLGSVAARVEGLGAGALRRLSSRSAAAAAARPDQPLRSSPRPTPGSAAARRDDVTQRGPGLA